ncbi:MAG: hypothetical protein AAFX39_13520 [Pseudomonadota bacterium]
MGNAALSQAVASAIAQAPGFGPGGAIVCSVAEYDDIPALDAANGEAVATLPYPGMFMRQGPDFFANLFDAGGIAIALSTGGRLIGYSVAAPAGPKQPLFSGRMPQGITPDDVGLLHGTVVLPPYRGMGLQEEMIDLRVAGLERLGRTLAQVPVAPRNRYSLNNLLLHGFKIIDLKVLLEGKHRFVMARPTKPVPQPPDLPANADVEQIALADTDGHLDMLSRGFRAYTVIEIDGAPALAWQAPDAATREIAGAA